MTATNSSSARRTGPLSGLRVLEIAGKGPGPFCGLLLADLGADVVRISRPADLPAPTEIMARSRRGLVVDLKQAAGAEVLRRLIAGSDVVFEGFRPGVAERLGIGPDRCMSENPGLIYGRVTGWGQDGPLAQQAGHDINYIGLTGVLNAIGSADGPPSPPVNFLGDYAGGGMLLAIGVLSALFERSISGRGQVVDAAMVDGSSLLATAIHGRLAAGTWSLPRGSNRLDSGAPYFDCYETSDGKYVSVGAIEPRFFETVLDGLSVPLNSFPGVASHQELMAPEHWKDVRAAMATAFATRSRDDWTSHFAGTDACVSPVLDFEEATTEPHLSARGSFVEVDGITQPAPAPRFSRTPSGRPHGPVSPGADTRAVLEEHGFADVEITSLLDLGIVHQD